MLLRKAKNRCIGLASKPNIPNIKREETGLIEPALGRARHVFINKEFPHHLGDGAELVRRKNVGSIL